MKKIISLLLVFMVLVIIVTKSGMDTDTFMNRERGLNNAAHEANPILLNETLHGKCTNSVDVDWYKFTLLSAEAVKITFSFTPEDLPGYWEVAIYDDIEENGFFDLDASNIYICDGAYSFPTLGLDKGTYYILVDGYHSYPIEYDLTVNNAACTNWETEFNDGYTTADNLSIGSTKYGICTDHEDVDWYKFTLNSERTVDIIFSFSPVPMSDYWNIYICEFFEDDSSSEINHNRVDYDYTGHTCTFPSLELLAGTYYIKVEPCDTDGIQYGITVNYT